MWRSGKGQILVVAAFAISLILLSVNIYVYKNSKLDFPPRNSYLSDYAQHLKQGSIHIAAASLINISKGGDVLNLERNIDRWADITTREYSFGWCDLNATLFSQSPYSDGVWMEWGTDGLGISSTCVDFTLEIGGRGTEINWDFQVNQSTEIRVLGSFDDLGGDKKNVTVIMDLYNEGFPILASSWDLDYQDGTLWYNASEADGYTEIDYGNGTYRYYFNTTVTGDQMVIRLEAYDLRGVFVMTEATLSEG